MTRNDELKAGQGLSVERVRALLDGRTPGEWYLAINNRPCSTTTGEEEDAVLLGGPIKNRGDAEIMILAPDLAHAYLAERIVSSALEVRIDDLTLERDRLAHELRLLREAVGQPVGVVVGERRRKNAEAVRSVLSSEWQSTRRVWLVSGLKYGTALLALHDAVALGWAERQKPAAKATKAFFRLAPLSSDTPERSGGEG